MAERYLSIYPTDMKKMVELIMEDDDNCLCFTKEALALIIREQYDEIRDLKESIKECVKEWDRIKKLKELEELKKIKEKVDLEEE